MRAPNHFRACTLPAVAAEFARFKNNTLIRKRTARAKVFGCIFAFSCFSFVSLLCDSELRTLVNG